MLKFFGFLFCCLLLVAPVLGQKPTRLSRTELGVMLGGTYYLGDLNRFTHYKNTQPAGGLIYRFNVHSRLALRGNFLYGKVMADDKQAKTPLFKNRNLNFESTIFELAGGIEFNYFPFEIGHKRYKGTAYILTGVGLFRMNPMTVYNKNKVALQPLGTEGQGTSASSKTPYGLTQLCIPLGVGARMSLGKRASINLEFGLRKTFTDYLDDVHSDTYIDPVTIADENGPIAGALSNRSIDGSRYGKRGTASNKDWYVFSGLMFTFRLGDPTNCFFGR